MVNLSLKKTCQIRPYVEISIKLMTQYSNLVLGLINDVPPPFFFFGNLLDLLSLVLYTQSHTLYFSPLHFEKYLRILKPSCHDLGSRSKFQTSDGFCFVFFFVLLAIEHVGVKFLLMLCLLFHKLFECFVFFLFIWLAP